jgi:predicted metalloprotease with PDZ domain
VAEFAKNVFQVEAYNGKGQKLAYTRPEADVWRVAGHDGTVRVVYKIFGDYPNGTYSGIDTTHAHLQMPAAFMWGVGHENQAMRITFALPPSSKWKIGTQLYTTSDPNTFTAPNLQYFMDSPVELSNFLTKDFTVQNTDRTPVRFRLIVHAEASQSDVEELAKMVERLVREQMAVFGEFPKYEPGNYTFLLDYVPSLGRRRRHGASKQHLDFEHACIVKDPARPRAGARVDLARVFPQLEYGTHSLRGPGAFRFHPRKRHVLSLARRRFHSVLRPFAPYTSRASDAG